MSRRILATIALGAMALLLAPQSAFADKPRYTCPPGFDLGALTFEQTLQLPKVQAGIAAGLFTAEDLAAFFDGLDMNDNGLICVQSGPPVAANQASGIQYAYNVVEDNASVPS